jgi:uncharacterized linocin/CFP29 family protein
VNLGREALAWRQEQWDQLDQAVHDEARRTGVAASLLPLVGPLPSAVTVPADELRPGNLAIDEGRTIPLVELATEFTLTPLQAESDPTLLTVNTLAVRAANLIVLAEDALVFQGDAVRLPRLVEVRGQTGPGLLAAAPDEVEVHPLGDGSGRFGERTFDAAVRAIALLDSRGHAGPYALALHSDLYADAFAPLPGTLATPADRIAPLVTQGLAKTNALPAGAGIVVSVGGNVIDLVIGVDPVGAITQVGADGLLHLRVFERFALRIKDPTALVRLRFRKIARGEGH